MGWKQGVAACAAAVVLACAAPASARERQPKLPAPSAQAREMLQWIRHSGDAGGRPFVIVDKRGAQLHVFGRDGRHLAATPVLLGSAPGDHTVPGVGERAQTGTLTADDRTTPAGRFLSHPGRNLQGEPVVWVDYASAFAIHRLRPGVSEPGRASQLATPSPKDNRSTLGCVVVPVAFYLDVIEPLLGRSRGVVYVLPERGSARDLIRNAESG